MNMDQYSIDKKFKEDVRYIIDNWSYLDPSDHEELRIVGIAPEMYQIKNLYTVKSNYNV